MNMHLRWAGRRSSRCPPAMPNLRFLQLVLAFLITAIGATDCRSQDTLTSNGDGDAARAAMLRHDYRTAELLYKRALEQNPNSAELLTDLGVSLQMQGRSTEAIQAFGQSLRKKYLPRTYALLTEEYCVTRDLHDAGPMLHKLVQEDAQQTQILAVIAPCFLDADDPLESVKVYTALLHDDSYPHDLALIRLAKSYLAVAHLFESSLRATSGSGKYMQALTDASVSGDPRSAFPIAQWESPNFHPGATFEQAIATWKRHQDDAALLYQLAVISGESSMQQVELCQQRYPNSPYLAQLEFEMLAEEGKEDEAVSGLEELLHSHPELPHLRYDLGMLYRKQHQWDRALAIFREELGASPQDEQAAARVSEALEQLARWQELRDFLAPRVRQKPPPLWACLDFSTALQQLGENKEAIHVLGIALANYPMSKALHWRLLILYRRSGDTQKAFDEAAWFKSHPG